MLQLLCCSDSVIQLILILLLFLLLCTAKQDVAQRQDDDDNNDDTSAASACNSGSDNIRSRTNSSSATVHTAYPGDRDDENDSGTDAGNTLCRTYHTTVAYVASALYCFRTHNGHYKYTVSSSVQHSKPVMLLAIYAYISLHLC
jgi:hypothetical protein